MKSTWKGINNIPGRAPQSIKIRSLIIGGTIYTSTNEISDALNKHFCSVGPILGNEIPQTALTFTDSVRPVTHKFSQTEISNSIILKLI